MIVAAFALLLTVASAAGGYLVAQSRRQSVPSAPPSLPSPSPTSDVSECVSQATQLLSILGQAERSVRVANYRFNKSKPTAGHADVSPYLNAAFTLSGLQAQAQAIRPVPAMAEAYREVTRSIGKALEAVEKEATSWQTGNQTAYSEAVNALAEAGGLAVQADSILRGTSIGPCYGA